MKLRFRRSRQQQLLLTQPKSNKNKKKNIIGEHSDDDNEEETPHSTTRKLPFSPNVIKKWCTLTLLFSFALLPCGDAGIESVVLRELATAAQDLSLATASPVSATHHTLLDDDHMILFWSNLECSVDAATQALGPLQQLLLLRGGVKSEEAERQRQQQLSSYVVRDDELPAATAPSSAPTTSFPRFRFNHSRNSEATKSTSTTSSSSSSLSSTTTTVASRIVSNKDRMIFSLFQKGDGSESDPDGIPTRYLIMQNHKREAARNALEATLQWRREHNIDTILTRPHPKYDICKTVFPHAFVGRDPQGHVVFVQRPALIDLAAGRRNQLTNQDLLLHYVYVNEYLWQILEADQPLQTMTSVMDLTGLNIQMIKKTDLIGFLKIFVTTMDSHFPQRAHQTLLLNAPKWFNVLYKLVTPVLRESTKAKIAIYSRGKRQDEALKKFLGKSAHDMVPPSFWSKKELEKMNLSSSSSSASTKHSSSSDRDWLKPLASSEPVSKLEEDLRAYTLARLQEAGQKMLPVR